MTLDASVRYSKSANPTLVETNAILSTAAASPLASALFIDFVEMQIEIPGDAAAAFHRRNLGRSMRRVEHALFPDSFSPGAVRLALGGSSSGH
jgi:hypothetical protein